MSERGGPATTYDRETRDAIAAIRYGIDTDSASEVWQSARERTGLRDEFGAADRSQ